jgi:hypothetical protein
MTEMKRPDAVVQTAAGQKSKPMFRIGDDDLRKFGLDIETIHEPHQGEFPGSHARFVLRSRVTRVEDRGVAA